MASRTTSRRGLASLLDVGSGPGLPLQMLLELHSAWERVVAIDPSEVAFGHLRQRFASAGTAQPVQAVQASITDCLPQEPFSVAVSKGASHHLDTASFFQGIHDCLVPQGVLLVSDEMLPPFGSVRERSVALVIHHLWTILDTLVDLPAEAGQEDAALAGLFARHLPAAMVLAMAGKGADAVRLVRAAYEEAAAIAMPQALSCPLAAFSRFHFLELQALVAGLDYEIEQKTHPARFLALARACGFELLAHQRIYATAGRAIRRRNAPVCAAAIMTAGPAVLQGIRAALPIAVAYVPVAFAFGAAAVGLGLSPGGATLVSTLMFSGASQALLASAVAGGMPLVLAVVLCGAASLRHLLYGWALDARIPAHRPARLVLACGLTDEVFAIALARAQAGPAPGWLAGLAAAAWAVWVAGTFVGAGAGDLLRAADPRLAPALAFALPALFLGLVWVSVRRGHCGHHLCHARMVPAAPAARPPGCGRAALAGCARPLPARWHGRGRGRGGACRGSRARRRHAAAVHRWLCIRGDGAVGARRSWAGRGAGGCRMVAGEPAGVTPTPIGRAAAARGPT